MLLSSPQGPTPDYDYRALDRELDRIKAHVFMRSDAAFFASLMCSLDFEWKPGLDTAATDAKTFWWDPADFLKMDMDGRKATVMHELWHVAKLHRLRVGNRCPDTWNKACDIWINNQLIRDDYKLTPPELWLVRADLAHMEVEEDIYEYLKAPGGGGAQHGAKCVHGTIQITSQVKQQTLNAVVKATQAAKMQGKPGAVPGSVERIVKHFLKPVIKWEAYLHRWLHELLDYSITWRKPNRRHHPRGFYLPTTYQDEGRLEHLMFFQDVSGSISEEDSKRFNSELKHIWETFKPRKLTIVQFDTVIQSEIELNEGDPFNEIRLTGFGGTCLKCVRKLIMDKRPNAAIIFSDLFVDPMLPLPRDSDCPVLWVAVGNKDAQVNFGQLIHIKG